jgi:hypothetical protein
VIKPLSPQALAWLRQSVLADGSTYSRVLLHLLERVEALEARLIPGAVELAADARAFGTKMVRTPEAAPVVTPMPDGYAYRYPGVLGGIEFSGGREINGSRPIEAIPYWLGRPPAPEAAPPVMQRLMEAPMDARGYVDLREPAPPAAPAGGLVERVWHAMWNAMAISDEEGARAAIREVVAWLDRRGQHGCSLLLREEADQ